MHRSWLVPAAGLVETYIFRPTHFARIAIARIWSGKRWMVGVSWLLSPPSTSLPLLCLKRAYNMQNPYVSGIVKLAAGASISAQIIGFDASRPQDIQIGSDVQVVFINRDGSEHKALAFEVVNDQ